MAWNQRIPYNSEEIRNVPDICTQNFQAIELGDDVGTNDMLRMRSVQLSNRTSTASNPNPTTLGTVNYLYSKADGGAVQEGYIKDGAGNVIQITNDGSLGSTATGLQMYSISFDGSKYFGPNNVVLAWGYVASNTLSYGQGISSVTHTALGKYTINLNAGLVHNANYACAAIQAYSVTAGNISWDGIKTTSAFSVIAKQYNGVVVDSNFFFMLVGGH